MGNECWPQETGGDSTVWRFSADYFPMAEFAVGRPLEEGSVPQSFTISPFPDQMFTVVETKYTIREKTASASWVGKIVGTDDGRIEMGIVGRVEQPGFVIKIFDGPQTIAILPTDMPDVYVSLEGNPNAPLSNNY